MNLAIATGKPEGAQADGRDVSGPRSLTRLLQLFDVLAHAPDGMTLAELNAALETPKSSLLNLLRPLVADGYLVHSGGAYRLGLTMFRLASHVLAAWDVTRALRPFLEDLAERTGETAMLAVANQAEGVLGYVDMVYSQQPVRFQVPVGTVRPLHVAAAGRVLLAFEDTASREAYLASDAMGAELNLAITGEELARELERIASDGYTVSLDQFIQGLASIAAPVFDGDGRCIAALAIGGPSERLRESRDEYVATVRAVAQAASLR